MEQFGKWYNQIIRPHIYNPKDKEPLKEGWRAALEWVRNDCIYTEDDGHQCISQGMIDEELGDT